MLRVLLQVWQVAHRSDTHYYYCLTPRMPEKHKQGPGGGWVGQKKQQRADETTQHKYITKKRMMGITCTYVCACIAKRDTSPAEITRPKSQTNPHVNLVPYDTYKQNNRPRKTKSRGKLEGVCARALKHDLTVPSKYLKIYSAACVQRKDSTTS